MNRRQTLYFGLALLLGGAGLAFTYLAKTQGAAHAVLPAPADVPLPRDPPGPVRQQALAPPPTQRLGPFQVNTVGDHATVIDQSGAEVAGVDGFLGARLITSVGLFGGPILELISKECDDPCNPTVRLIALRGGQSIEVLSAAGAARLTDLNRDGIPEVLLDHLMEGTSELITIPLQLRGTRFVGAYASYPDEVDRQLQNLSKAVEQSCTAEVDVECRGCLLAILGLAVVQGQQSAAAVIGTLHIEPAAKSWALEEDRFERVQQEADPLLSAPP